MRGSGGRRCSRTLTGACLPQRLLVWKPDLDLSRSESDWLKSEVMFESCHSWAVLVLLARPAIWKSILQKLPVSNLDLHLSQAESVWLRLRVCPCPSALDQLAREAHSAKASESQRGCRNKTKRSTSAEVAVLARTGGHPSKTACLETLLGPEPV